MILFGRRGAAIATMRRVCVVVTSSLAFFALTTVSFAEKLLVEEVSFTTRDGVTIQATLASPTTQSQKLPAVIFIHQGGSSRDEWVSLPIFNSVVESGMVALAIDIRGHGDSSGKADFDTLFDDPNQAPQDLRAAIDFLMTTGLVDRSRVAVVGASIGSNLACVASGNETYNVKTAVAMSGKTSAVLNLAGVDRPELGMKSVFHISSEFDQEGLRAEWAAELFEMTDAPSKLEIVADSSAHGVSIFIDDPTLQDRVLRWLLETL